MSSLFRFLEKFAMNSGFEEIEKVAILCYNRKLDLKFEMIVIRADWNDGCDYDHHLDSWIQHDAAFHLI